MKIAIFTNTYLPHVGGVANSVASLEAGMRKRGHEVLVIAPDFPDQPENEEGVVRIPAIKNFNGTDFSVKLPSGNRISEHIKRFQPDLIHCHHPFLLGDAGMRAAHQWDIPLVFTHHTRYEDYIHYVLEDSDLLERLAIELATEYANLCDAVIAPSGSIEKLIQERGVVVPIFEIPTGIDRKKFADGDGASARKAFDVPEDCFLLGHVGRLAEEKNLKYLVKAVVGALKRDRDLHFLLVGSGELEKQLQETFDEAGLDTQVHHAGKLKGQELVDAYHALDLFLFTSKSETQGMVIAEAMAAGVSVLGLDASGVRDILEDSKNGRMLGADATSKQFAEAIAEEAAKLKKGNPYKEAIDKTADAFSMEACLDKVEELYRRLVDREIQGRDVSSWKRFTNRVEAEWDLAVSRARAVGAALTKDNGD